jgi:hypothetical protein
LTEKRKDVSKGTLRQFSTLKYIGRPPLACVVEFLTR